MELATKGLAQLADLFRSMTPGARITAALLLIVTVVSIGYLFNQPLGGTHVYLMGGESFAPGELRDMQAALGKAGLEAECEGARIKIPLGQESKYMAALADAGALPAEFGHHMQQAVNPGGFMRIPHSQQAAAWLVAKQQELQRAIGAMHGIERAAVQIDEEETDDFPRAKKRITAAVMVFPDAGRPLDAVTVGTIRKIMVGSVSGLDVQAVTVVDMTTNRHYSGADDSALSEGDYADQKQRQELEWKHSIGEVLAYIPGVLVSATVELAAERAETKPGPSAAPRRVTVSVAVPQTYYEQVWRKQHATAAGQPRAAADATALAEVEACEKQKIEQLVANLLPRDLTAAGLDGRVVVSTFCPLVEPPTSRQALQDKARALLGEHWRTLSLGAMALVGLVVLRSMFRSIGTAGARRPAAAIELPPTLSVVTDSLEEAEPTAAREPFERREARRGSLNDELAEAVRDDPDAALGVLRSWIGNAS